MSPPIDKRVAMALEVSTLVATGDDSYDKLLEIAAEIVGRAMADVCVIALLSDDGEELHPLGLHHRDPAVQRKLRMFSSVAWSSSGGASGIVLATGRPVVLGSVDLEREARDKPWLRTILDQSHLDTAAAVALRASGERSGLLGIARRRGSPPITEDEISFVQAVADRLALAVENLRLKEEIERLRQSKREVLLDPRLAKLTGREFEILELIGTGLTSREISEQMFLSVRTVEWHRRHLSEKVGATQRSELVALALTLLHR